MSALAPGDRVLMLEADTDEFSEFVKGQTLEIRTGTVTGALEGDDIEVRVDTWNGSPPRASSDDGECGYTSYYARTDLLSLGSADVERVAQHLESVARKLRAHAGGCAHGIERPARDACRTRGCVLEDGHAGGCGRFVPAHAPGCVLSLTHQGPCYIP